MDVLLLGHEDFMIVLFSCKKLFPLWMNIDVFTVTTVFLQILQNV